MGEASELRSDESADGSSNLPRAIMKLISQGAEAKLYQDKKLLIKDRTKKSYRIKEIDDKLRGRRTRREAKILSKLRNFGLAVPKLYGCDDAQKITMDFIPGDRLSEVLDKKDWKKICKEIGEKIGLMHNNHIIHGDLTTSNMILHKDVYFIDFGLSYESFKVEDMAVDLHILKQALESKHWKIWEKGFDTVVKGYLGKAEQGKEVMERLVTVEKRGRDKQKAKKSI